MAEAAEENELDFSDIDSDDETPARQPGVIAHKVMQPAASDEEFEAISPPQQDNEEEPAFEPISPSSDPGGDKETEETNKVAGDFDDISDDENEAAQNEDVEGKFSPTQESDNELNFDVDETSNDSGYQLVPPANQPEAPPQDQTTDALAPVPSPLSDDADDSMAENKNLIESIVDNDKQLDFDSVQNKELHQGEEILSENQTETEGQTETDGKSDAPIDVVASEVSIGQEVSVGGEGGETQEPGEDAGDIINDIFGESDEEEEFEGFDDDEEPEAPEKEEEQEVEQPAEQKQQSDSESDDEPPASSNFVSDFDLMLEQKKAQKAKRKSKKDIEYINDNDDIIIGMIRKMKEAAENDRMLNQCSKAATNKMKMLNSVMNHLNKADIQGQLIDNGILMAIKEWLTPLPDHALPHVNIRKSFLKILNEFPPLDKSALKSSGIGRAVMLLYKHPKELTDNRKLAGKIISTWARPIFNVSSNFSEMSREERMERDRSGVPAKKRRLSSEADKDNENDESRPRKPGDKGWIGRARVPMPSHRDYLNRPVPKVEVNFESNRGVKKELSRYEKHMRKYQGKKPGGGAKKSVNVSLNGGKMAL